ncbi:RBGP1-like protein, partial [Mya arenaria]
GDEPLLSGSGVVSKEITDENLLEAWREVLKKWQQNLTQKPKQESSGEGVIQRDINRTFPAHDFFKESGGLGQESLFKIAKAYSVYDEEIGYCQGQSFLIAALLLHMPEEQAFCVLVKIMFDYGLRDFFRNDFGVLHLAFYQLERLLQMGLEAHMYASQWFLTLFTAKFPLFMVFHILDIFLSEGRNFAYHVALGLLKVSRKDLLALDFEGVLKYFRVALNCKIRGSKLKKYEKEYQAMKEQEMQQEDPLVRFERENKRLMDANIRLEQENDDMAHELVESKLNLSKKLDAVKSRLVRVPNHGVNDNQEETSRDRGRKTETGNRVLTDSVNPKVLNLESRVRELELELAQTKLALVEAECKSQDLTHQLTSAVTEIQASKNTWFSKFQNSIKDVSIMQKKDPSTKDLQRKDSTSKE